MVVAPATGTTIGRSSGRTAAARGAIAARSPRPSLAVSVLARPTIAGNEGDGDSLDLVSTGSEYLDALGPAAVLLDLPRSLHRGHHDALEIEVGLGPQDIAHLGHRRHETTVQGTPRFLGPRGAPSPGPVLASAGQLNIDPSRHPTDQATSDGACLRTGDTDIATEQGGGAPAEAVEGL
jgi:hypothetical protein